MIPKKPSADVGIPFDLITIATPALSLPALSLPALSLPALSPSNGSKGRMGRRTFRQVQGMLLARHISQHFGRKLPPEYPPTTVEQTRNCEKCLWRLKD